MAGQEIDVEGIERAPASAGDPAASIAFRGAVVAATRATDDVARRAALRDAAGAAISLAVSGGASELRSLLTPDPVNSNVTWSVACYQIGDLTPSAVRDFADAAEAVATVSQCNDIGHVAAELVASTSMGIRWVALVRTNTTTQLRLPDADATSDSTGKHASELGDAQRRWRRRIAAWAEGTDSGIDLSAPHDDPVPVLPARDDRPSGEGPSRPAQRSQPAEASTAALREQLAAIERQVARLDAVITGAATTDEERAGRLHAMLSEVEARLVDASLDTRSGLAGVEQRLGERVASVRDTIIRGLDATNTSAADTRDLVDASSSTLAEQLRTGVRGLGDQLATNEARLIELTTGLLRVVERLDRLDAQAKNHVELVRTTVRDDLAELADHVDAGHRVLDRRRQRGLDDLVATVKALSRTSVDEVSTAVAASTQSVDATADRLVQAVEDAGAETRSGIERLEASDEASTARLLAAVAAQAADADAATELVLEAAAQQAATAEHVLAAIAEVGTGTEAAAELVVAAIGDNDTAIGRVLATLTERADSSDAALGEVLAASAAQGTGLAAAAQLVLAAIDDLGTTSGTAIERLLATLAEHGDSAATTAEQLLAAIAAEGQTADAARDELLAAIAGRADTSDAAVGEVLATVLERGELADAAAEQIRLAITEQGTASGSAVERLLDAIAAQGGAAGRGVDQILGVLAEQGAESEQILAAIVGQSAGTGQILAAIERARTDTASGTRQVEAAVEQLSLELADITRAAATEAIDAQHRRLAASVEEARRELTNDLAITRGVVDGSVEGAAARTVRQLASQLENVRVSTKSDLAAVVVALRDEQQRERRAADRRAEEHRRTSTADTGTGTAELLAAVERLADRLDRLEASQQALRESLVGP